MSYHRVHTPYFFDFCPKKQFLWREVYQIWGGQMMYPTHVTGSDFAYLTPISVGTVLLHNSSGDVQWSFVTFHCNFMPVILVGSPKQKEWLLLNNGRWRHLQQHRHSPQTPPQGGGPPSIAVSVWCSPPKNAGIESVSLFEGAPSSCLAPCINLRRVKKICTVIST